jgi:transcriptional regulator with XRE-family HTH domain
MKTRIRSIHDRRHRQMVSLITKARIDANLSQSEIADALGLKQPDISKIENNERRIDFVEVLDILGYIGKKSSNPNLVKDIVEQILGGGK